MFSRHSANLQENLIYFLHTHVYCYLYKHHYKIREENSPFSHSPKNQFAPVYLPPILGEMCVNPFFDLFLFFFFLSCIRNFYLPLDLSAHTPSTMTSYLRATAITLYTYAYTFLSLNTRRYQLVWKICHLHNRLHNIL